LLALKKSLRPECDVFNHIAKRGTTDCTSI
jgi:hypothetical protein